jgi:hypothetical protein
MSRTKLPTRLMRRPPRRSHSPKRRCARASSGRTSVTPVRVGRHDEQRHAAPAELTEAGVPHDLRSIRERNIPFSTTRCGTTTLAPRPTRGNGCSPSSRSTSSAPLQRRALNPNGLCLPRAVANWPRIGPAAYRTMTQEDGLRGEANSQVDGHLIASPQVAVSSREPSQGGDTGSNPVGTTTKRTGKGTSPEAAGELNDDSSAEYPVSHRAWPVQAVSSGVRVDTPARCQR